MDIILYLTLFLGFVPIVLLKIKTNYTIETYYIEPLLWLVFFSSAYELVATLLLGIDSDIWFRTYIYLEFFCLLYLFSKIVGKNLKWLLGLFTVLFIACYIYSLLVWNSVEHLVSDSYLTIIQTIFIYVFAFVWFKDIFTNLALRSLWDSPVFYFISAFFLYYSGTFFLFLMSNSIFNESAVKLEQYWILNIASTLLLRTLLIIGVWKGQQKSIPYSG